MKAMMYCYSVLYLLGCEVHKWLKINLQKSLRRIAYQQSQKAICFHYVDKKTQNYAGLGFNSLTSYAEPFWQDGRHTGEI